MGYMGLSCKFSLNTNPLSWCFFFDHLQIQDIQGIRAFCALTQVGLGRDGDWDVDVVAILYILSFFSESRLLYVGISQIGRDLPT